MRIIISQHMNSKIIIAGIIGLALLGLAAFQFGGNKAQPSQTKNTMTTTQEPVRTDTIKKEPTPTMEQSNYKNGTYTAEGDYTSPGGAEKVKVTVTIKDNLITDSQFASLATRPTSKKMQGLFSESYKALVVGKNINEINLDVVNGSSLTPIGFEDALKKIRQEAAG